MKRRRLFAASAASAALIGARAFGQKGSFAAYRARCKDAVVVIPGITGSILQVKGREVWSPSFSAIWSALSSLGRSLDELILQEDPVDEADLGDGVTATALVPDLHVIPGLWKIDGYSSLRAQLFDRLELREGENYFEFPYDWRRDNRVAARRLARLAPAWLETWRRTSGEKDAGLIILAHSMGGLVGQYFVECLQGWRHCRALVTIGTPYRGSLNALNSICNGLGKRLGPIQLADLSLLLRSFTSTYQLLPRYPCIAAGAEGLKRIVELTGLPGLDADRARLGRAFLTEIEDQQKLNARTAEYQAADYVLVPIAGGGQRTLQTATLADGVLAMSFDYPDLPLLGDGTVPEVSSSPVEFDADPRLAGRVRVVTGLHSSLQGLESVVAQIVGLIKVRGELGRDSFSGSPIVRNALHVEDVYDGREPVVVECGTTSPARRLTLSTVRLPAGIRVDARKIHATDEPTTVVLGRLPAGAYRIAVAAPGSETVSDVFLVAGP